jgi:hypothetical protein
MRLSRITEQGAVELSWGARKCFDGKLYAAPSVLFRPWVAPGLRLTRPIAGPKEGTTASQNYMKIQGIVGMMSCGVCLSTGWVEWRVLTQCGFAGPGGVYTPHNCAMIFVRAYAAACRLREPDGNQVEDPPRFDALNPQPSSRSSKPLLASSMSRII